MKTPKPKPYSNTEKAILWLAEYLDEHVPKDMNGWHPIYIPSIPKEIALILRPKK